MFLRLDVGVSLMALTVSGGWLPTPTLDVVEVRVARSDEWPSVVELILAAWRARVDDRSSGHRLSVGDIGSLVAEGATVLVADDGLGDLLGAVTLIPSNGADLAEISKLAVRPRAFSSGVAEALMTAAHHLVSSHGGATLLAVSLYQPELVSWYARFGYVVDPARQYRHAAPTSPKPIVMVRTPQQAQLDPIGDAVSALQAGRLVGMPTETVYGLAADASNPLAVRSVFAAKGRPVDHPLIVHLASRRSLDTWAVHSDDAHLLAAAFWPGPLTIVLPRQAHVLDEVTGGRDTVAVRVPQHPLALTMIAFLGPKAGLVAPSANPFGAVSPTTADHVRADGLADVVIDGGPTSIGVESTIVELGGAGGAPQILRPGAITAEQIAEVLGRPVSETATGPSRAPGMLASHYAPRAGVRIVHAPSEVNERGSDVGYLGPRLGEPPGVTVLPTVDPYTADSLSPILYARLREADHRDLRVVYIVAPSDGQLRDAVQDRLSRAAHEAEHQPALYGEKQEPSHPRKSPGL
jgi:L-threonylcarbamoyladenylate synthase